MKVSQEKVLSLTKYREDLQSRLQEPTPKKHVSHPNEYREFLIRELKMVSDKLEQIKMSDK